MFIKKLDSNTISLISAGEVIEGPADVLKELIENSIDANAKIISINIKSAGIDLIEVVDDGDGISKEDLNICLEKYTTSKINKIDDLYSLDSFGFRGEALFSISSVSLVEISSSIDNSGKGCFLDSNKNVSSVSFNKGTKISIQNLFYNLPARKKFLKSKSAEFSKIYDVFLEFVIANPHLKFIFTSEKKKIIFTETTKENRYFQVFGKELLNQIIDVDISSDFYRVSGFLLKPQSTFVYSRNFIYINNRCVNFSQIQSLVKLINKDYLMVQQKPFFILFFKINPKTLDVNVHPKKRIIKLQNEQIFLIDLKQKLSSILFPVDKTNNKANFRNGVSSFVSKTSSTVSSIQNTTSSSFSRQPTFSESHFIKQSYFAVKDYNKEDDQEQPLFLDNKKIEKILGQLHNTYIVCETSDGFLLIDQHAAAERINLEKNQLSEKKLTEKQSLISKKKISFLNEHQKQFLKNNKPLFSSIGFDYSFTDNEIYLTSVPFFLKTYFDSNVFLNLVNDLQSNISEDYNKIKSMIIKKYSCSESIKANQELSLPEIKKLIKQLDGCEHKTICAHGRPTTIFLNKNDLEKMFKRIV